MFCEHVYTAQPTVNITSFNSVLRKRLYGITISITSLKGCVVRMCNALRIPNPVHDFWLKTRVRKDRFENIFGKFYCKHVLGIQGTTTSSQIDTD